MRQPIAALLGSLLLLLVFTCTLHAEDAPQPRVKVTANGQAPASLPNAREAAIEDALRRCVEAGGGVELASASKGSEFALVSDVIYTRTAGFIERYKVLEESPSQDGVITVRVEAIVTRGDINTNLMAFKSLLKRRGYPRLMVVGTADGKAFDTRLTAIVQDELESRAIKIISAERKQVIQGQAADRAGSGDLDVKKAALIAQQAGADYLVIVTVEGEKATGEEAYGVKLGSATAAATIQVVKADTAEVLASKVSETTRRSTEGADKAARAASGDAVKDAVVQAIRRVAQHWMEDVDVREGQQVAVVMHKYDFHRSTALIEKLRKISGVKEVIVDRTDAEATGQIRIVTNSSATDVAAVLIKLDPRLEVVTTSGATIEVK